MRQVINPLLLFAVGVGVAMVLGGCGGGSSSSGGNERAAAERAAAKAMKQQREEEVVARIPGGPDPQALVIVGKVPGLGPVLIDSGRKTLYRFGKDVQGSGTTHCYGACTKVWYPKASYKPPTTISPAIDETKFGTITRREGYRQATYHGWPLYTYIKEGSAKSKGAGRKAFGGTWYALNANGESVK